MSTYSYDHFSKLGVAQPCTYISLFDFYRFTFKFTQVYCNGHEQLLYQHTQGTLHLYFHKCLLICKITSHRKVVQVQYSSYYIGVSIMHAANSHPGRGGGVFALYRLLSDFDSFAHSAWRTSCCAASAVSVLSQQSISVYKPCLPLQ